MTIIDPTKAVDFQKLQQQKEAFFRGMDTECRGIAIRMYERLLFEYLDDMEAAAAGEDDNPLPDPQELRRLAFIAFKSSAYLHQALGVLVIDEDANWKHDDQFMPPPLEEAPR